MKKRKNLDNAADSPSASNPVGASASPAPQSPVRIAWVRQTPAEVCEALEWNVRLALRHMHLAFSPNQKVVGFVSEEGSPLMLQAAEPKTIKLVAYSNQVTLTPPGNVHHIIIWFRMAGSSWQQLYLLDPREVVAADSPAQNKPKEEGSPMLSPFWNAITSTKRHKTSEQSFRERQQYRTGEFNH